MSTTIADIKNQIPLDRAIQLYAGQRPQHGKYLCPFHPDRHPSLSVKGTGWRCWSCGEHGDVIDFTRKYYGLDFRDAVTKLSEDFGLSAPEWSSRQSGTVRADPLEEYFEEIRIESNRKNREEVARIRQKVKDRIDALSTAHRLLMRHGAPQWQLDQYGEEIDGLILFLGNVGD